MIAAQLLLILLVIRSFRLVPPAWGVLKIAAAGFVIHALVPMRYRLPVFIALSVGAIVQVLGYAGGTQLIVVGVALIAICHLPVAWGVRVTMLLGAGVFLAVGRSGMVAMPVGEAVWAILGSIFMFRLIIYMYDIRHDAALASWSGALSYFFLLPNPIFPFFPVVDYKTFRRSYYDSDAARIYQTGVAWMMRGVVHLILYRFVYYYLTLAPEEVQTSGQLARFVIANYALYLRVSGTFHFIVGLLHLFGFNLPLSNNLYFLASSFTDYWRRVNIYWKDFMLKVFYYPSYFWLRRWGPLPALVLSTLVVFLATTVLHSYQWFWLRGSWYMSTMDILFWSTLAVLVLANVVWEAKRGRRRTLGVQKWSLKVSAGRILQTLLTFIVISSLWSLWSAPSLEEWTGMWSVWNVGAPFGLATGILIAAALALLLASDYLLSSTQLGRRVSEFKRSSSHQLSPYLVSGTLLLLLIAGHPRVRQQFDSTFLLVVEDLQHERLSRVDQGQLERGYYENLFTVEQTNPELARRYSQDTMQWVSLWQTEASRETGDLRRLELVPSVTMRYKGQLFTTNSWGMRDRERGLEPPAGTYRFGVLGASTTMGSGVADGESYPSLIEERFNGAPELVPVELLNFAVESYNVIEQVAVVDQKVVQFQPHGLLYIAHETEFEKTLGSLASLVESRTDLVYDELRDIIRRAGLNPGMPRTIALRRLGAHRDEVIAWGYRHIASEARSRGILPVWVFIPMPVPGTGPCPPGSAQLFCFGNLSRAGAAADATDPRVNRLFALAREAGFVVLDLSNVYGDTELTSLWIAAADGHPNIAGHRMIADGLFTALRNDRQIVDHMDRVVNPRSQD
jgi:hypothetical protein